MPVGLRARVRDAIESVYLPLVGRRDLPPYSLRCHVGPLEEYETTPAEYIAYLKLLGRLSMDARVLDIGCGTGRFAAQLLARPHFFQGLYEGFDIDERAVRWATRQITSDHPNARFTHVDLYNSHYRPDGFTRPEEFVFPYPSDTFDLAFAVSVFTHLPSAVAEHYLHESARVLPRGGRALFSFLLLGGHADRLGPLATERLARGVLDRYGLAEAVPAGTLYHLDGFTTLTPSTPETVTLYEETVLEDLADRAGLRIEAIHPGSWAHEGGGPAFQDLVVLSRRSTDAS